MQTSFGQKPTIDDIVTTNFKRQAWDPWLPNSYVCLDEQPAQPIPHDPKLQAAMQQGQYSGNMSNRNNEEQQFISMLNNAKNTGDTATFKTLFDMFQRNYFKQQNANEDISAQRAAPDDLPEADLLGLDG